AFLRPREPHPLAQRFEQRVPGLDEHLGWLVVHREIQDLLGQVEISYALARASAVVNVRRVRTRARWRRKSAEPRWALIGRAASTARSAARLMRSGVHAWPSSARSASVPRRRTG